MRKGLERMPIIEKSPLCGFSLYDEFPVDKMGILHYYDVPLESHWIRKDGRDYINTFFDTDDTRLDNLKMRELLFEIEPKTFLDYQKGMYSYSELIEMSGEYFVIEYVTDTEKVWSMTHQELVDLYDGELPFGTTRGEVNGYDDYFEDEMKPYLTNKIRNTKIKSLKL